MRHSRDAGANCPPAVSWDGQEAASAQVSCLKQRLEPRMADNRRFLNSQVIGASETAKSPEAWAYCRRMVPDKINGAPQLLAR